MRTKVCVQCGLVKSSEEFSPEKKSRDKLRSRCKKCDSAISRMNHLENDIFKHNRRFSKAQDGQCCKNKKILPAYIGTCFEREVKMCVNCGAVHEAVAHEVAQQFYITGNGSAQLSIFRKNSD